jgi:hypothetical protein
MAGKKGMKGGGGKRDNQTGRPLKEAACYSDTFKEDVLAAVGELEEEQGTTFLKQAFSLMYDDKTQSSVKASLLKTFSEIFAVTKTESKVEDKRRGPVIGLPPIRGEDPALKVVEDE